jgi:hypothetical protein
MIGGLGGFLRGGSRYRQRQDKKNARNKTQHRAPFNCGSNA